MPGQNNVQLVEGQIYPVVGHPVLRKIVGADSFAPVSRSHLAFAVLGDFGFLFALHRVEQARAEHLQRLGLVFVLRFFVLADYDQPCRNVGYANGRIGRVDALASGARRTEYIHADIVGVYEDVHFFGFGKYGHGDRRGVNPSLAFRYRDSLHPVDPALELQPAEGALAVYRRRLFP